MESNSLRNQTIFDEFNWENIGFVNVDDSFLACCQWRLKGRSLLYVVYRWVVLVLLLAYIIYLFLLEEAEVHNRAPGVWMVNATNWSVLFVLLAAICMAINATKYVVTKEYLDTSYKSPSILSCVEWFICSIAYPSSLTVTIAFWSFIFTYANKESVSLISRDSQIKHCLFSIYVLVDIAFNAVPTRLLHILYPLAASCLYIAFNAIYFRNNGISPTGQPYAYYLLDWRQLGLATATCVAVIAMLATMHVLLFTLYRLKMIIFWKTKRESGEEKHLLIMKAGHSEKSSDIIDQSYSATSSDSTRAKDLQNIGSQ